MSARPVPALPCGDAAYDAGFHDNVKLFVSEHGVPLRLAHRDAVLLSAWRVRLAWPAGAAPSPPPPPLYVVEERLDESDVLVCDQCRIMGELVWERGGGGGGEAQRGQTPEATTATRLPPHPPTPTPQGWQHHPVCVARYHFVVPSPADTDAGADDGSQPAWLPPRLESPSHLLHATLHANGFGHLVRVNGVEGGALGVTGAQLMGTWDALARSLRARVVSVEDVSNKGGMELRVLIPAARRATWYGRWGYGYGRAPYGGTRAAWRAATSAAAGAPLPALAAGLRAAAGGGDALARDAGRVLKRLERVVATATTRGGSSKIAPPPRPAPTLGALLDGALGLLARPDALAAALAAPAPGVVRSGGGAAGARARPRLRPRPRAPPAAAPPARRLRPPPPCRPWWRPPTRTRCPRCRGRCPGRRAHCASLCRRSTREPTFPPACPRPRRRPRWPPCWPRYVN